MREIKFRCWRDGYMCSYYPKWRFVEEGLYWEEKDADPDKIGEGEPVLMQYTGLKDKNGVEIYEGDIVRYTLDGELFTMNIEFVFQDNLTGYDITDENEPEIIGNIYENPELLK